MKIAMIGQKGIPISSGGIERHVEEIGKRLVEHGHDVTVYNRKGCASFHGDNYEGINIRTTFTIRVKGFEAAIYSLIASIDALFRGYDVIHYHALGPAAACMVPRILGKKVVVTVHGLDWQRKKWGRIAKAYLKFGEKVAACFSNEIISVSVKLKDYFAAKYKRDSIFIPNGVLPPVIREANLISKYGLYKNGYILFLARLVPEKGCQYLLEAYSKIDTDVKLVLAGDGSYTDAYCRELYEYKGNNIIFTGEVKGELLEELYSNALCYVLPSEIEGMPISLLEAMSYGICSVVSDIEENLQVVNKDGEDYGYTFKTQNSESLKEKLIYMLNNREEILMLGKKAQEYVLKNYDWERITGSLEDVYKSLVSNKY